MTAHYFIQKVVKSTGFRKKSGIPCFFVLWMWINLREKNEKGSFSVASLRAETYADALAEGLQDQDLLTILDQYDMRVTEVEYITQWADENRSYEQKYKEQVCFHMCDLFGVQHINCGLLETYPLDHTAQKLKELCRRAGKRLIALEPMPYSGVPTLAAAWEIVQASGCSNAGLLLDLWHWVRAQQPLDGRLLEEIPADRIVSLQIDDVLPRPYASSVLRDESMHDRLAPGTGCGRTADFVQMFRAKGVQPAVLGVEVISDALLQEGVPAAAQYTYACTRKVLEQAWPQLLEK